MSQIYNDLLYYNNLFQNQEQSAKEQSTLINWSERKCYIFKFFIKNLTDSELQFLKDSGSENDYEVIASICLHDVETRAKLLSQLKRIENACSPFEEIQIIFKENCKPNPLNEISNSYWKAVRKYLEELEIDSYPFNGKAIKFLSSVANRGYSNLTDPQRIWINGLISYDHKRSSTDHYFVNDYLIQAGFKNDCQLIQKSWANL